MPRTRFLHSGFSVDASVTVWPQDTEGLEHLCRYLLRCPLSLSRIHWKPGAKTLFAWEFVGQENRRMAVSPDGARFLLFKNAPTNTDDEDAPQIILVEKWFEELKARVPVN